MKNILTNKEVAQTVRSRVLSLLQRRKGKWNGTMTDLFNALTRGLQASEVFPGSPSSLRRVVDQVVPAIRRQGYRVEFTRTPDHDRKRVVSFTRVR